MSREKLAVPGEPAQRGALVVMGKQVEVPVLVQRQVFACLTLGRLKSSKREVILARWFLSDVS